MCFHPYSDLQLVSMTQDDIIKVIERWMEQTAELGEKFKWVSIFENKGVANSNNHPHCQVGVVTHPLLVAVITWYLISDLGHFFSSERPAANGEKWSYPVPPLVTCVTLSCTTPLVTCMTLSCTTPLVTCMTLQMILPCTPSSDLCDPTSDLCDPTGYQPEAVLCWERTSHVSGLRAARDEGKGAVYCHSNAFMYILATQERIVVENEHWLYVVPFW